MKNQIANRSSRCANIIDAAFAADRVATSEISAFVGSVLERCRIRVSSPV